MTTGTPRAYQILLAEDEELDIILTREALASDDFPIDLHVVRNGEEALDFLYRRPPFQNAVRPQLVLLDLNMPRKGGHEVLADIKRHPDLAIIPVIVLTTSDADEDILKAYNLNANCFIRKPLDMNRFRLVMQELKVFWFDAVTLPPEP